jgi:endonuclease/exonuclease/phosphatase family metal-dependent hydrolase
MKHGPQKLRVVTYNIHKAIGLDRLKRPSRIVEVLRQVDADVVGLQEVVSIPGGKLEADQPRFIAENLGFDYKMGITRSLAQGVYGNVILSRFPFLSVRTFDITCPGKEERGCLHTDIAVTDDIILHVYNVHLGTTYSERRRQARSVVRELAANLEQQKGGRVLLGDFNDWTQRLPKRLFSAHFAGEDIRLRLGRKNTYPGILPFLHLDHIYFDPELFLEAAALHRSRTALVASDHLPLVADFLLSSPRKRSV